MNNRNPKQDIVWMTQDEVCASVKYGKSKINYLISSSDPRRSLIFPKPNKKAGRNLWLKSDIDRYKEWVLVALPDVEYDNWIKSGHNDNPNSFDTPLKLEMKTPNIPAAHDVEIVDSPISEIDAKRIEIASKILKKAAGIPAVASSDASPAVPAREPTGLKVATPGASLDAHAESKENIVDVSSSKVLEEAVVMTELAPLATADKQLLSESDADKYSVSVAEASSRLAENASGNDESDMASVVIANFDNVIKKILPIVNHFYFRPDQRSAYLKDLIEDVAKEKKWVSFRELILKFELKIENADDLWLRDLIKKLSEQSFKESGVHLSVLVGDDTVYRWNPDYYPCPEFLSLMGADNLDKNKVLALAWREMTKVHQAYQTKRDI